MDWLEFGESQTGTHRGSTGSSRSSRSSGSSLSLVASGSSRSGKSNRSSQTTGTILTRSSINTLSTLITLHYGKEGRGNIFCIIGYILSAAQHLAWQVLPGGTRRTCTPTCDNRQYYSLYLPSVLGDQRHRAHRAFPAVQEVPEHQEHQEHQHHPEWGKKEDKIKRRTAFQWTGQYAFYVCMSCG